MKKTLLISGTALLVLTLVGAWLYFFILNEPAGNSGAFSLFDADNSGAPRTVGTTNTPTVDVTTDTMDSVKKLQQLTTRRVAGATFVENAIRYAEQGTGHVYEISLTTGEETRVSGTTFPQTTDALFSPHGSRIVITTQKDNQQAQVGGLERYIGTLTKNDTGEPVLDSFALPQDIHSISFSETGEELRFLARGDTGGVGYRYTIAEQDMHMLFATPLRDLEILWGTGSIFAYTTPTARQTGYIYKITDTGLEHVDGGYTGLTALRHGPAIIITHAANSAPTSYVHSDAGTETQIPVILYPEKCTIGANDTSLYCAIPDHTHDTLEYPDDWYKGTVSFSDSLYTVDPTAGSAQYVDSFEDLSGRQIDVMALTQQENQLLILDKNTRSLWLYQMNK